MEELDILMWIHGASPTLDAPMTVVAAVSAHALCWVAIAVLLLASGRRRMGASVILAMALAYIVADLVLKPVVGRLRPFEVCDIQLIVDAPGTFSFPSGHSACAFAAASCIALRSRRLAVPAIILAAVIAYSRLYLFVHWPTDVLAGAMLGIIAGAVVTRLVDPRIEPDPVDRASSRRRRPSRLRRGVRGSPRSQQPERGSGHRI